MKNFKQLEKKMTAAMSAELTDEEFDAILCQNLKSLKENNPVAYSKMEEEDEANRQEKLPFVEE